MGKKTRNQRENEIVTKGVKKAVEDMFDKVEALTADMDTMPNGPYHTCSFDLEHDESCTVKEVEGEGPVRFTVHGTRCSEMDKWDVAIHHERIRWKMADLDPAQVTFSQFESDIQLKTIIKVLVNKGITTLEELNDVFKPTLYAGFKEVREGVQPDIEQARRNSLIAPASAMPLLGPNGKPILH